jgi:hypothetical protein
MQTCSIKREDFRGAGRGLLEACGGEALFGTLARCFDCMFCMDSCGSDGEDFEALAGDYWSRVAVSMLFYVITRTCGWGWQVLMVDGACRRLLEPVAVSSSSLCLGSYFEA